QEHGSGAEDGTARAAAIPEPALDDEGDAGVEVPLLEGRNLRSGVARNLAEADARSAVRSPHGQGHGDNPARLGPASQRWESNFRQVRAVNPGYLIASNSREETMFDHVGLPSSDFAGSGGFCRAALEPLGYALESHDPKAGSAGFGKPGAPQLWLGQGRTGATLHLAFQAPDRASVQRFHAAALKAGGKD